MEKNGSLSYYDFYFNWYNIVYHNMVIELQFMIMVIFTDNLWLKISFFISLWYATHWFFKYTWSKWSQKGRWWLSIICKYKCSYDIVAFAETLNDSPRNLPEFTSLFFTKPTKRKRHGRPGGIQLFIANLVSEEGWLKYKNPISLYRYMV
jgi:hypothetical protein